jgi:hypothetical protein
MSHGLIAQSESEPAPYRVSTLIHELIHIATRNSSLSHSDMYNLAFQSAIDTRPSLGIKKIESSSDAVASIMFNEALGIFCKGTFNPPTSEAKKR